MKEQTKCVSVNLSTSQIEEIKNIKELTGKSQNAILLESINTGLKSIPKPYAKIFLVKIRVDIEKLQELGTKLQSGELDTSPINFTYCIEDDPTVGVSLWGAKDREEFDKKFAPHALFYKEVIDIQEVVLPEMAMELILQKINS